MPNRILRDWTDSEPVNSVSVHAERTFARLIMKADDFGRLPASLKYLRPLLYPYLLDQVREADLQRWLAECDDAGLIRLYDHGGKQYLEIQNFRQRTRASESKYPAPPPNDGHAPAKRPSRAHGDGDGDGDEGADGGGAGGAIPPPTRASAQTSPEAAGGVGREKSTPKPSKPAGGAPRGKSGVPTPTESAVGGPDNGPPATKPRFTRAHVEAIYAAYPRKVGRGAALVAIERALVRIAQEKGAEAYPYLLERVRKYFLSPAGQRGKFTPHCATWMNQARYEDDDGEWRDEGEDGGRGGPRSPNGGGDDRVTDSFVGSDGHWNDRHTQEELDAILGGPDIPPFPHMNTPRTPEEAERRRLEEQKSQGGEDAGQ